MKPIRIKRNGGAFRRILELKKSETIEVLIDNENGTVYKKVFKCVESFGE